MGSIESRQCQNCKCDFTVESEDFDFYKQLDVPAPTFCFDCRTQRRMMFRNERTLHRRKNNAPSHEGEDIISIHRPDAPVTVYDDRTWWSDAWDPMSYGKDYDFSRPFFEQYKELYRTIPLINLSVTNMVNCNYCNVSEGDKGSYMLSASFANEDSFYSNRAVENKQSSDVYIGTKNELSYELVSCTKNFKVRWAEHTYECSDCSFLYDCKSCTNCIGCTNLRNKSYCILNEQLDKESFEKRKEELNLESYAGVEAFRKKFRELVLRSVHKYGHNVRAIESTGDNLDNVNNLKNCYDFQEAEHCKNVVWGGYGLKDSMDGGPGVGVQSDLIYDAFDTALQVSRVMWTSVVYRGFNIQYSINCHSSSNLFGCHGLRKKEYCILNKQYTKEEYESLIPKIKKHMEEMPYIDAKGRAWKYGEFFPYDISPFCYNETVAQEYYPLTKEQAIEKGYAWLDRPDKNFGITVQNEAIPDDIKAAPDSITNDIIECAGKGREISQCAGAFKIIPGELQLYRQLGIPLPRYCYNCRHYNRLKLRNPMKLWHRACMCEKAGHDHEGKCKNEFETPYAPERPEIVYCEQCYQKEIV